MVDVGHFDHIFKILLIGDAGVGKSSILLRFTDDAFEEHLASTIGVDFKVKTVQLGGKTVKLTIWDTAGQERFRTLTSSYYRGCHGIILVFDVNERASFESLERWLKEAAEHGAKNPVYAVCANKADGGAAKRRAVGEAEGRKWAADRKMGYFETSAKDGDGVGELFLSLFTEAMAR